jgi:large conductance mechanosensitive channel
MLRNFRAFIARGSVIELAVAVVIGAAFGVVVKSFVDDIIMPPIGLALGHADFTNLFVVLKDGVLPPPYASLAQAKAAGAVTMNYGIFINAVVGFLIVAFAVFLVVRSVNRMSKTAPAASDTKPCPHCAMSIPLAAKRCPHCTSQLSPIK